MKNQIKKDLSGYPQYRYFKKIRKNGFGQYKTVPYTRRLSIKYYCMECVGFVHDEMKNCTISVCPLLPYRFGKLPEGKTSKDRAGAIRSHCLECVGDDWEWISKCPSDLCPVHPYRLSGYKTDSTSLIPAKDIEKSSQYDRQFEESGQKMAV